MVCARCVPRDRLTDVLTDRSGTVRTELAPLLEHLCGMRRPRSGLLWLTKVHTRRLLGQLADGSVALTHDGIATLSPNRAVIYLRDLLVASGVVPPVDKGAYLFDQWAGGWLPTISDPDHRRTVETYLRWHLRHLLQRAAETAALSAYRDQNARYRARQAAAFLTWLDTTTSLWKHWTKPASGTGSPVTPQASRHGGGDSSSTATPVTSTPRRSVRSLAGLGTRS